MGKRKIPVNMPSLDFMPDPEPTPKWTADTLIASLNKGLDNMTAEERELLTALTILIRNGLLPDDYETLYRLLSANTTVINMPGSLPTLDSNPTLP